MSNNGLSKQVLRCAKQVYTHLGKKELIDLLSKPKEALPFEVIKMQNLLNITSPENLDNTIRKFMSWNAPNQRKKTIADLVNLIEEQMIDEVDFGDDFDEDFLVELNQNEKVQENPKGVKNSLQPIQTKNSKRALSPDVEIIPTTVKKVKTQFTPDFFNEECFKAMNTGSDAHNIICSPSGGNKFFENVSWITLYEISRFVQCCRVPWNEIPVTAFQTFINTAISEPKKLYETMVKWNQEVRLGLKLNGLAYTSMERCPDSVWTYIQKLGQKIEQQQQLANINNNNNVMLSPVSPIPTPIKKESRLKNRMIHYSGVLQFKVSTNPPTIILHAPKVGASNRFFRKFGHDRFLELKLSKSSKPFLIRTHRAFFLKPFLFMHRVFRFLFIKDDTVILFATEGIGLKPISIQQVIEWHMPIVENWSMTISKYASRMSLGYSSSIPTLEFKPHEIRYVDDIYVNGNSSDERLCMTDGCGIISPSAMKLIMGCQATDELPCAIQGRIAGAKGIWIIAPDLDFTTGNYIEIRKSQDKFKTGLPQDDMNLDPLHYTFDLVKNSVCVYPSNLNTQFIQSLAAGGVPTSVFIEILKEYTHELASVITENQNIKLLRDWVAKRGNIMNGRWEGETNTEKGLWSDMMAGEDENDSGFFSMYNYDDDDDNSDRAFGGHHDTLDSKVVSTYLAMHSDVVARTSSYNKINRYSGLPAGLHESVVRLIDAGFDLSNAYVATRVTQVFRQVMISINTKYKIEVPQSCTVTCVPDPTNSLKPGEIFLQLSSRRTDEKTGIRAGQILGDCVVTRNPCGLKSDVQKVKAVDCTKLRMYTDVVIFSVQGEVSLASQLSGGDYDGDIVFCCWDERIVQPFNSSPVPEEPERVGNSFERDKTTLGQEIGNHPNAEQAIQNSFISINLPDGALGQYENWRTVLAEHRSLNDPDVIYLAHMCAKLVDAPKQGLKLTSIAKSRDRVNFAGLAHPPWFMDKRNKQRENSMRCYKEVNNVYKLEKNKAVTTMDHLYETLLSETVVFTRYSRSLFSEDDVPFKDAEVSSPWIKALKVANQKGNELFKEDLDLIAKYIRDNRDNYNNQVQEFQLQRSHYMDNIKNPSKYSENRLVDELQSRFENYLELEEYFAKEFNDLPPTQEFKSNVFQTDIEINSGKMLQALKASYAYILSVNMDKYSKYSYVVAYDAIRRIKGDTCAAAHKENGLAETVSVSAYKSMNIDRKWLKRIKESSYIEQGVEKVRLVPDLQNLQK